MRMQNRLGAAMMAMALLGAAAAPATAQKSADTLRIVMRDAVPNIDPYYNNLRTGVVMHHQGWDALIYRNPDSFSSSRCSPPSGSSRIRPRSSSRCARASNSTTAVRSPPMTWSTPST